jgi:DNA-binding NarL/FixJ family response regulator
MFSILIVEDHKLLGETLARVLRVRNFEVPLVVETAVEALEQLDELKVDLVLADVSLPDTNGIDLVAQIHKKYPDLPCLMISGHTAMQYVSRAIDAGARGYVVKEDIAGIVEGIQIVLEGGTYLSKQLNND